jgi:hypothetical protein
VVCFIRKFNINYIQKGHADYRAVNYYIKLYFITEEGKQAKMSHILILRYCINRIVSLFSKYWARIWARN